LQFFAAGRGARKSKRPHRVSTYRAEEIAAEFAQGNLSEPDESVWPWPQNIDIKGYNYAS
jgi:hypothetical protein